MKFSSPLLILSLLTTFACSETPSSAARKLNETPAKQSSNSKPADDEADEDTDSADSKNDSPSAEETKDEDQEAKTPEPTMPDPNIDPKTPDPMMETPTPMKPAFPDLSGKLRLMPLGASFTQGVGSKKAGYRGFLHQKLSTEKIDHVFVGSNKDQPGDLPADQQMHEGHPGFVITSGTSGRAGITDNFKKWLGGNVDPQIIMLLVGSNDVDLNYKFDQIGERYDAMISMILDKEKGFRPNAILLASSLALNGDATKEERTKKYNAIVKETVDKHFAKGEQIYFIDTHAVLTKADMTDNLHANDNGYPKVAQLYFDKIKELVAKSKEANKK